MNRLLWAAGFVGGLIVAWLILATIKITPPPPPPEKVEVVEPAMAVCHESTQTADRPGE